MEVILRKVRDVVRGFMSQFARYLNRVTKGKLSPDGVTLFGFIMHIPVALLIAARYNIWAAIFLVIFGLFDSLDGALARAQDKVSSSGGLLDASTDRMKEALLYSGAAYALALSNHPATAAWAAAACGASVSVSYVKAKGEAIVAADKRAIPYTKLNHIFADGLLTFEVRMTVLVVGLLVNQLAVACALIAVFAGMTALGRLSRISKYLREE
ncbi:MAG TPA: CDP-alcohol phosphatidyltransferase family protein [Candidatus Saccharimonadales bacterium]|nr:CDP-alcohol phosphatidyltransferase family protein [Candidatus Saccharimonadales bacterium]